jgi:hypothetical protein
MKAEHAAGMLPIVTAEEWLATHRAAEAAEDAHRDVNETDLDPDDTPRDVDQPAPPPTRILVTAR